jgi:two-component system OmpR family response regulator
MRILLVEDDLPLARELKAALNNKGYAVDHVDKGATAISPAVHQQCDIGILDLGLPDMDGLQVLKAIKQNKANMPMLILTARDGVEDRVHGLDLGADDYMVKPFAMEELFARIRVLERKLGNNQSSTICVGPVIYDGQANTLSVLDKPVDLSRRELMIVKVLLENIGRIQSKDSLETKLYEWGDEVSSNAVEVHVSNLRKKLPPDFIKTVRGVGYVVRKA